MSAQSAKRALRRTVTQRLKAVPQSEVAADSSAVAAHVLSSAWYTHARSLSCYLSTPVGEVDTNSLILHALSQGKRVFVPFCPVAEPTAMRMLRLRSVAHFEGLKLNRWGIRELDPTEVDTLEDAEMEGSGALDLILVPGLAFDKKKQRLGHGRGYYDRYIEQTRDYPTRFNKPSPFTAALALRSQLVLEGEEIPTEEWDKVPDVLVTPDGEI